MTYCGVEGIVFQLEGGEGKERKEWVKDLLQRHHSLLLELVREGGGGGREEGVRGEDTFLWPFLDLSLTSPGEYHKPLCTVYI